jgi:hypothetical protein
MQAAELSFFVSGQGGGVFGFEAVGGAAYAVQMARYHSQLAA